MLTHSIHEVNFMELIERTEIEENQGQVDMTDQDNYAPVRYNAMTHGILSKLVVLPHEENDEFERLRDALVEEHQPSGPTEMHLVEELAAIMWRQRRVLLAENAEINMGLRGVVRYSSSTPAKSAAPFMSGMPDKPSDWLDLMQATPEQVEQSQKEMEEYWNLLDQVWTVLRKGGSKAYAKALKLLPEDDRETWEEWVAEEEYQPTGEGLREFLEAHLRPMAASMHKETLHHFAIKQQTLGEGLRPAYLQNLCRYETHLDRKFERTLAMLIKLKELRGKM
jgi:hypothetical protein